MKFLITVFTFLLIFEEAQASITDKIGMYFSNFIDAIKDDFSNEDEIKAIHKKNIKSQQGMQKELQAKYDFKYDLYKKYLTFAYDRYNEQDYVDAFYFKQKANKIKNYKIISPANPFSFGIIAPDLPQFLDARKRLKDVSLKEIIESQYGEVLADSYLAYDCWLEAFENGNSVDRARRCRDRFIENIKALEMILFDNGIPVNESILSFSKNYHNCKTCTLNQNGLFCNALYFEREKAVVLDKMNIVIKKLQQKSYSMPNASIIVMYPKMANHKLQQTRLDIVNNIIYNQIIAKSYIEPVVKFAQREKGVKNSNKDIYEENSVLICVKDTTE